jgi:hypothetical protein
MTHEEVFHLFADIGTFLDFKGFKRAAELLERAANADDIELREGLVAATAAIARLRQVGDEEKGGRQQAQPTDTDGALTQLALVDVWLRIGGERGAAECLMGAVDNGIASAIQEVFSTLGEQPIGLVLGGQAAHFEVEKGRAPDTELKLKKDNLASICNAAKRLQELGLLDPDLEMEENYPEKVLTTCDQRCKQRTPTIKSPDKNKTSCTFPTLRR